MDYCSRRHLNGALVCPGCGAYAPDIAPGVIGGRTVPGPATTAAESPAVTSPGSPSASGPGPRPASGPDSGPPQGRTPGRLRAGLRPGRRTGRRQPPGPRAPAVRRGGGSWPAGRRPSGVPWSPRPWPSWAAG
ncbi:SCO2400 family protein [Streptomyces sp. NPDC001758]